jgi:tetratricopeptide (TPR) repeat protein
MYKDWLKQEFIEHESLLTIRTSPMPWIITIFDTQRSNITMFKQVSKTFVPLALVLWYLGGASLYGQQNSVDIFTMKEASMVSFDQGSYSAALAGFRTLLELDGRDPLLSYYAGRCLVELNVDLDEAIELLYAASRQNEPADAIFYLGRAYHLNYNFKDARSCYEKFDRSASKQDRKKHGVKHLIATCKSATEITSSYNPFEVMNVTFMDLSDSLQYSQVKMKGGVLSQKPKAFFHLDEDDQELTTLMFRPKDPVRGDYVYFSGYGRNKKDGAQLYRVRKGNGKAWGDPQEVSSLNTPGNEILPYFDPIENDLYFASDGRYGVGGYDLYKSHYDMERDQWSEPLNLGFPVNSVADEYLLLPGTDLGMVLFFSNRQRTDTTVTIYRVHLVEPKKKTALNNDQQLREIARLGGVAEEMQAGLEASIEPQQLAQEEKGSGTEEAVERAVNREKDTPLEVYQETLALALRHQAVSDSLKDLASNARINVRGSDDPNDRWVWQKQIMVWEKKARDEEQIADLLYQQMEQERLTHSSRASVNPPETIEVDRELGDLTVYRYTGSDPERKEEPASPTKLTHATPALTRINHFDILSQAPYSTANPIPMDLDLPQGAFYRIQLGAFAAPLDPDTYGGISPISGEYLNDRGLIKYYAGKFSRYDDASSALPRIHSLGYEDAFIVAWYNGIQVATQKAKQLE